MQLADLPKVSYEIAVEKGWWDEERPLADLLMLMVSELSEALEDYRNNHALTEMWFEGPEQKPCGIPSELADVVIRIADLMGRLEDKTLPPLVVNDTFQEGSSKWRDVDQYNYTPAKTFVEGLLIITRTLSKIMDVLESLVPNPDFRLALVQAAKQTFALANKFGIDLMDAIEKKTAYNRTRPRRHGGKRI